MGAPPPLPPHPIIIYIPPHKYEMQKTAKCKIRHLTYLRICDILNLITKEKIIKILSLFDGISGAQVAINNLGITDYTYYASETELIDKIIELEE